MEEPLRASSEECLTDSLEDIPSTSSREGTMSMRDLHHEDVSKMEDMTHSLNVQPRDAFSPPKLTRSASVNLGEMTSHTKPRLSQHRASLRYSLDKGDRAEKNERYICSAHRETPRENKTSRRRRIMSHEMHVQHESCSCRLSASDLQEYLTPLQRKDRQIRELREDVKRLQSALSEQHKLVDKLLKEKELEVNDKDCCNGLTPSCGDISCDILNETFTLEELEPDDVNTDPSNDMQDSFLGNPSLNGSSVTHVISCNASGDKDDHVAVLTSQLQDLKMSHETLVRTHESTVQSLRNVQASLQNLQEEMENRESEQAEMFLRMFKKGQQSAQFERQDELELILADEPYAVSLHEMTEKLRTTESKLEFWQSLRTKESYDQLAPSRLTDAEVTLQFVKASLFHYLTDRGQAGQHLKAMIGIMGYSDSQLKSLEKLFSQNRKKRFNLKAMKASFNMMKF